MVHINVYIKMITVENIIHPEGDAISLFGSSVYIFMIIIHFDFSFNFDCGL